MSKEVLEKLIKFSQSDNIAEDLDEDKLMMIAQQVKKGFDEDLKSTEEWKDTADRIIELTELEREEKHYPMRNASNVKLPNITIAAQQLTSRTLPEFLKNDELAKSKIIGQDLDGSKWRRGKRVSTHLNYQMLEEMDDVLDEFDQLLMQTSVLGIGHAKSWFDPKTGKNKIEFIPYDEFVVNEAIRTLEEAERKTQCLFLSEKEIIENQRFGIFRKIKKPQFEYDLDNNPHLNDEGYEHKEDGDPVNVQELLEQHCFLDLDGDFYAEPYVVTIHKKSLQVLRIVPRFKPITVVLNYNGEDKLLAELIDSEGNLVEELTDDCEIKIIHAIEHFTDFKLMHKPSRSYYPMGLGHLLLDLTETSNTTVNQLLDAGRLANLQGGFIGSRLRIRGDTVDLEPGEWLKLEAADGDNIKNQIVPLNYKEPSTVLFQLLMFLVSMSDKLASSTDALTGTQDATNVSPHVMLSLVQQGMQVYLAYQRRIFRGYKKLFAKLIELNKIYVDPQEYIDIINPSDDERAEMLDENGNLLDYLLVGNDVVPVADLKASTEAERLARLNVLLQSSQELLRLGAIDPRQITKELVMALDFENPERFIPPPQDPKQNPDIVRLEAELDEKERKLNMQEQEFKLKMLEAEAKIKEIESKAVKNLADAEAAEAGRQLEEYKMAADSLLQEQKNMVELAKVQQQRDQMEQEAAQQREMNEQEQADTEQEQAE